MKIVSNSYLFLVIISLTACNSDVKRPAPLNAHAQEPQETVVEKKVEVKESTDTTPRERLEYRVKLTDPTKIAADRASALSILNHRLKSKPKTAAMIEAMTWEYAFVYDGEMSAPDVFAGVWVDFKPDHTYTYGKLSQIHGTGKYNYHVDREELLMIDDNSKKKPEEWKVLSAGETMVLQGTATYRDNYIQMKLVKVSDNIQSS